ncbi:YdcF family protein [Candidatus Saccharibacteria bacterium]|nr:YdcF family protein [Candidatus Saccharibacteria bacterium]MCB9834645.1 YdcF family protein [Candidatus Nomurabacteria bacterium]
MKKAVKKFFIRLILVFALFAGFVYWAGQFLTIDDQPEKSAAIIVISGGQTLARAQTGLELFNKGYSSTLIFSGAVTDGDSDSNAEVMKQYALDQGVPESAIITEDQATNTLENAERIVKLIGNLSSKRVILVTSPYHQKRSYLTFHKVLGDDWEILSYPSTEPGSDWSKYGWWRTAFGWRITISELAKITFIMIAGRFS